MTLKLSQAISEPTELLFAMLLFSSAMEQSCQMSSNKKKSFFHSWSFFTGPTLHENNDVYSQGGENILYFVTLDTVACNIRGLCTAGEAGSGIQLAYSKLIFPIGGS